MIFSSIALGIIIFLCIFILYKVRKEESLPNAQKRNAFSFLLGWVILWSISILVTDLSGENLVIALWASRLSFFTSAFVGYSYYLFVRTYIEGKYPLLGKIFFGAIAMFFVVTSFTENVVKSVSYVDNNLQSVRGDLHIYFTIYTALIFCYSAVLFFTAYKRESNLVTKSQIFYIFSGSMLSILSSFSTNLILPILGFIEIRALGPLSLVFFILSTYYAILHYRFPSTKLIINKFVYLLVISILPFAIFHLVSYLQNTIWGSIYAPQALVTGFIYSALFVSLFVIASRSLEKALKKFFSDYKIDLQAEKEELIIKFNDTLEANTILTGSRDLLERIFRTKAKIFVVRNGKLIEEFRSFSITNFEDTDILFLSNIEKPLVKDELLHVDSDISYQRLFEKYNIEVIYPIKTSKLIDWEIFVVIESGTEERSYTIQDLEHIRSIGSSMAIALQRAYLYLEVENFNRSLQEKVNEQTKELQIKIKELEEARRKEADMIDIMGHELRTPATVVKLNVELLEKYVDSNPADFKKYIDRIKKSVDTEIALIKTLLTSAKLEGDKIEIRNDKVDIKMEIEMALSGHEVDAKERGLECINKTDPNTPYIFADRTRVVEILNNLISNAIKYTIKGGISVGTTYDDNFVTVTVADTGKGIPPEKISELGGKFFRIDNYLGSEIVRPGGTGLGLYITFGLIRLMGGEVSVKSELGKGSAFVFTLPVYNGQKTDTPDSKNMFEKLGLKK